MKTMIAGLIAGLAALAAAGLGGSPARAEVIYPWCITIYLGDIDAIESCGFVSYEQCKMSMVGRDTCSPNYAYFAAAGESVRDKLVRGDALPPIVRR